MFKKILRFSDVDNSTRVDAGIKAAKLGDLFNADFPVPDGFVILSRLYFEFIEQANIKNKIYEILNSISNSDSDEIIQQKANEIQKLIILSELSEELKDEIIASYSLIDANIDSENNTSGELLDDKEIFVAVRPSPVCPKLINETFAGVHVAFTNIKGSEELIQAVKGCWASLFTSIALKYRLDAGDLNCDDYSMAVIVQKMVDGEVSGKTFGINLINKSSDQCLVAAVYGLGEGIKQKKSDPDLYHIDKHSLEIVEKDVRRKEFGIFRGSDGKNVTSIISPDKQSAQILDELTIKSLVQFSNKLEKHFGAAQEFEWTTENDEIKILQSNSMEPEKEIKKEISSEIKEVTENSIEEKETKPVIAVGEERQEKANEEVGGAFEKCVVAHEIAQAVNENLNLEQESKLDKLDSVESELIPENDMEIIYFVHGTTYDNEKGLMSGHNPIELSELGIQQSNELRNKTDLTIFDAVFCSDLKRAVDSAKLAFADFNIKINIDPRLRECDFGDLTQDSEERFKEYEEEGHNPIYDQYPKGECFKEVEQRILSFLNDAYKQCKGKRIAIVAHRYTQLAIDVLLKHKTWEQARKEDWRLSKAWQPGWNYIMQSELATQAQNEMVVSEGTSLTNVDDSKNELTTLNSSQCLVSGEVQGKAKIVHDLTELSKVKQGDIILASKTKLDMVVAISRAAGLVTEENDENCVGAIVCKDLGIPCVIGHSGLTDNFRDGDLVNFNSENCEVRKIE